MFSATFRDTKNMKYLADALSELAEDALLFFEEEGMRIEAADPSLICKIEAFFSRKEFLEYNMGERGFAGIDVESLARVARRARHEDIMRFALEEGALVVILEGTVMRNFANALIEPRQETLPKIEIDFPVNMNMDSSVFREMLKDVSVVGNTVIFGTDECGFSMTTEGDTGRARIEVPKDNPALRRFDKKKDCSSKFNLGYLLSFLRASFVSDTVVLSFGDKEVPLKMLFPFEEGSHVTFYLAPMEF